MKFVIISGTAAVFAAAVVAGAPAASADPEANFLKNLQIGGFSWADESGGQVLVDAGHEVCASLDSGASAADMITDGGAQTGWTGTQMGYFVGAAASSFCPEHLERALAEAQTLDG